MSMVLPLLQWQASYRAEVPTRLTQRDPGEEAPEGTRLGVNLAQALVRYADDGLDEHGDKRKYVGSNGRTFPVHDAMLLWERHCRAKHARWAEHRGRPVCAEIAWAVIRDQTTLSWASAMSGVTEQKGRQLLDLACQFMGRMQARWMESEEERNRRIRLRAAGV